MDADEYLDQVAPEPTSATRPTPFTTYSLGASAGGPDEMEDPDTNAGFTSTGPNLTEGVVSVNDSVHPLGTIFRDEGSGFVFLAADRHGNDNKHVVDIYADPKNYKRLSGVRDMSVIGQIKPSEIPTSRAGVRELLSRYGKVPGLERPAYGTERPKDLLALRDEVDREAASQLPTDEATIQMNSSGPAAADYIEVPGLPGRKEAVAAAEPGPGEIDPDKYETKLSDEEEEKFQTWKAIHAPADSGEDYDLRGAFKAGLNPDPKTGHWPDTFKKPNHPTFSDQSIYAKDRPDLAGHWKGDEFVPPKAAAQEDLRIPAKERGKLGEQVRSADAYLDQAGPELMGVTTSVADAFKLDRWKDLYTGKEVRRAEKAERIPAEGYLAYTLDPKTGEVTDIDLRRYRLALQALRAQNLISKEEFEKRSANGKEVEKAAYEFEMLKLKAHDNPELGALLHGVGRGGSAFAAGMAGGRVAGAIGATIGSAFPGPGTTIGGVLGGIAGFAGGAYLGNKAYDKAYEELAKFDGEYGKVLADAGVKPGWNQAGEMAFTIASIPISLRNLAQATKTIYAAQGAKEATKFAATVTGVGAGTMAGVDTVIRLGEKAAGVEGAEGPTVKSTAESALLGALTSGFFVQNKHYDLKALFDIAKRFKEETTLRTELGHLQEQAKKWKTGAKEEPGMPPEKEVLARMDAVRAKLAKIKSVSAAEQEALQKATEAVQATTATGEKVKGVKVDQAGAFGKTQVTQPTVELTAAQRNKHLKTLTDPNASAAAKQDALMALTGKAEAPPVAPVTPPTSGGPVSPAAPTEPAPTEPAPVEPAPLAGEPGEPQLAPTAPTHTYVSPEGEEWWKKAEQLQADYFATKPHSSDRQAARAAFNAHQRLVEGTGNKFSRTDAEGNVQSAMNISLAENQRPAEPAPAAAPGKLQPGDAVSHPSQGEGTFVKYNDEGRAVIKVPHGEGQRFATVPADELTPAGAAPEPAKAPAPAPAPRNYVQNQPSKEAGEVPVEIDVAKLEADWKSSPDYVPTGGPQAEPHGELAIQRYRNMTELAKQGAPIEMPNLFLDRRSKRPAFIHGTNQFAWLRDQGDKTVTVVVDPSEAEEIRARFGVGAPEGPVAPGDIVSYKGKKWRVLQRLGGTGSGWAIEDLTKGGGIFAPTEYLGLSDIGTHAKIVERAPRKAPAAEAATAPEPAAPKAPAAPEPAAAPLAAERAALAAKPTKVKIHAYDVVAQQFTMIEAEPTRFLLAQLKMHEAIYEKMIKKCL